ncbi:MAG TPA: DNA polymerase domain-containing protein [Anaerolineales bacterium]|nr:DNA polymerase domain-containing protein [Anaerolineales bacterium]
MNEWTGWLLDLYPHPENGIVLWLLCDDGQRRCLRQDFSASFYAAGPSHRLRALWQFLLSQSAQIKLSRTERQDLFNGSTVVLRACVDRPAALPALQKKVVEVFPDITLFDIDLRVTLRHSAVFGTFPFARCHVAADEKGTIHELNVLDSRWDIDHEMPPIRVMTIKPDLDPEHAEPKQILVRTPKASASLDINDGLPLLAFLGYFLRQYDPDLILSSHGDTWIFPLLLKISEQQHRCLPLNRDHDRKIIVRPERSYFAYNQVIYRGQQIHLAGRIHVDACNAVMYHDYGLNGVFEMARVTALPIQTAARVSPGTGISSMQIVTALKRETLIPVRKEQVERPKTTTQLFREDLGGVVFDPIVGLHPDVAEIDFASMYPSIMAQFNISPETVNTEMPTAELAPTLDVIINSEKLGLIPETLVPLLKKRLQLKATLRVLSRLDCRYKPYKAQSAAHKWLMVTCFGYLGYKNARFGRIEAHEAVTAYSREVMMRAKEAAEDMGFRVLHLYVDGMWVQKPTCHTSQDFQPLLEEIQARTKLIIALEGVYNWIAFLPSCTNKRVAVPNRYFGAFQDGEIKTRGIEVRRHDTPAFVSEAQKQVLEILAKAPDATHLMECMLAIRKLVHGKQTDLRAGRVPLETLIVHQTVSRNLDEYRTPTPAMVALQQLENAGKALRPGQTVRLIYTLGKPTARAWDLPEPIDPRSVDVRRYCRLLIRAINNVLEPVMGIANPLSAIETRQLELFATLAR